MARESDPRSLDHLRDFFDTAEIGLHWVGSDGTILWANEADYRLLGYSAEEYVGHNIAEFHADPEVIADILRRLSSGERLTNYEARLRCRDGSTRPVQITSSVLFEEGPDGRRFVHTRCYTQDITERRRIEQARDHLVRVLGHDLRNPLNAIRMGTTMLTNTPDLPPQLRDTAERMARATARMTQLVSDLTDMARMLDGRLRLLPARCDFADIARPIVDELRLAHPDLVIDTRYEGDLAGDWDAERVGQAISNLIGNATQHGAPPIALRVTAAGSDAVRLEVENTGEMSAGARDRLLAHSADLIEDHDETPGTRIGLGLFIVRAIADAHGATIDVIIQDGRTAVRIDWPRQAPAAQAR